MKIIPIPTRNNDNIRSKILAGDPLSINPKIINGLISSNARLSNRFGKVTNNPYSPPRNNNKPIILRLVPNYFVHLIV